MDWSEKVLGKSPHQFARELAQKKVFVPTGPAGNDRRYVELRDKGISIVLENNIATCVHLYSEGRDGYAQYSGPLPGNLTFSSSRRQARLAFGAPTDIEEGVSVGGIAGLRLYPFDSWVIGNRRITIEYNERKTGIRLVTIMGPGEF